jgi:hypothetical protein
MHGQAQSSHCHLLSLIPPYFVHDIPLGMLLLVHVFYLLHTCRCTFSATRGHAFGAWFKPPLPEFV